MQITGHRAWPANLHPILQGIALIPTFIGRVNTSFTFIADLCNGAYNPACCQILTKALVCKNKGRIAAGTLPILSKEEGCQKACYTSLCPLLKSIQQTAKPA